MGAVDVRLASQDGWLNNRGRGGGGGETGVLTLSETVVKIYTAEFDVTSHSACITYALTRLAARISIRQQILNANLRGDLLITRAV